MQFGKLSFDWKKLTHAKSEKIDSSSEWKYKMCRKVFFGTELCIWIKEECSNIEDKELFSRKEKEAAEE